MILQILPYKGEGEGRRNGDLNPKKQKKRDDIRIFFPTSKTPKRMKRTTKFDQ